MADVRTGGLPRDPWAALLLPGPTRIMGILNVTPDSFADGGRYMQPHHALEQASAMVRAGADCIDIGAESTRPGAYPVDAETEWQRLEPALELLIHELTVPISVDTYKAGVAESALTAGARIINDVWGLQRDPDMAHVVAKHDAGVVIMHNQPGQTYVGDLLHAMMDFFHVSLDIAHTAGIDSRRIVLDPGIGFGKSLAHNLEAIRRLRELDSLGYPLLLGVSRKSVIGKTLNLPVNERVEGTLACNVLGIAAGARILRVHDIEANLRAARMADAVLSAKDSRSQ